jgi:uncharacterized protein (DUF1778 family)
MGITEGLLTYEAEGNEGGPFHSRTLSVPSASSGLTIGRGYDMKEKTASKIAADLADAGVEQSMAELLSQAAGLNGADAEQFIVDHDLREFEITIQTQEKLFNASYAEMAADVKRICDKEDCVAAYGPVDWDNLEVKIKEVIIDLRYRGDYTPTARKRIQKSVADNALVPFSEDLSNRSQWQQVPQDRFQRRVDFLQS